MGLAKLMEYPWAFTLETMVKEMLPRAAGDTRLDQNLKVSWRDQMIAQV